MRKPEEIAKIIESHLSIPVSTFLTSIGLAKNTISNMKSGSMPSADKLCLIADELDVSVDYLLGIEKTPLEPIALKAPKSDWIRILERLSDENLVKLRDYALLLLLSQGQAGQGDQGSQK
jgi:transcriptional regulator with XRE-family HTH domain